MSDSLLHRWSKQKAETRTEEDLPPAEPEAEVPELAESETEAAAEAEQETEEPIELPSIESLDEESDYSLFMSPEVDEGLRKLALRKLFKSPFFNVVDGLNDYDDDFTTFEALGDIVTSDMRFHERRKKAEEELKQQQIDEAEDMPTEAEAETLASDAPTDEAEDLDETQSDAVAMNEDDDSDEESSGTNDPAA